VQYVYKNLYAWKSDFKYVLKGITYTTYDVIPKIDIDNMGGRKANPNHFHAKMIGIDFQTILPLNYYSSGAKAPVNSKAVSLPVAT